MTLLRIAILHDPDFQPALPALPVTRAMRVLATVSIRDRYVDLLRIALPNVIVADLREWPEQTGRIIANLRAALPLASILVVGAAGAVEAAHQALRGGAYGYVTRDTSCGGLLTALDAIANGRMFVSRTTRTVIQQMLDEAEPEPGPAR
jgi:DNA-binding NarL/FixJ family response regulator